jgi:hypothetical protein
MTGEMRKPSNNLFDFWKDFCKGTEHKRRFLRYI